MKHITLCLLLLTTFPLDAQSPHETRVIDYLENESDAAAALMPNTLQVLQDSTIYGGEHFIKITFTTTSMGHPSFLLPALEDHTAYFLVNQAATEIIFGFCLHYPAFDWDYLRQRQVQTQSVDALAFIHPPRPTEISPIRMGVAAVNHTNDIFTAQFGSTQQVNFRIDGGYDWGSRHSFAAILTALSIPPQELIYVPQSDIITRVDTLLRPGIHLFEAGIIQSSNPSLFLRSDTFSFEILPVDSIYYYPLQIGNKWDFITFSPFNFKHESISDTVTINNQLHYRIPSYFHEGEAFFRADSLHVYRYYQGEEVLWHDFSIDTGQTYWNNHYQVNLLSKTDTVVYDFWRYEDCYHFYFDDPNSSNDFAEWISPFIGPVKRLVYPANTQYYLVDATLQWIIVGTDAGKPQTPLSVINSPELYQNYPNPFNAATTIRYRLPRQSRVTLEIYNVLGQKIAVLADGVQPAGEHHVSWEGRDQSGKTVASGVYLYRLAARGMFDGKSYLVAKKLILMK